MKRKSPIRHTVGKHKRNGKTVQSFERGSGKKSQRSSRVVRESRKGVRRLSKSMLDLMVKTIYSSIDVGKELGGYIKNGKIIMETGEKGRMLLSKKGMSTFHTHPSGSTASDEDIIVMIENNEPYLYIGGLSKDEKLPTITEYSISSSNREMLNDKIETLPMTVRGRQDILDYFASRRISVPMKVNVNYYKNGEWRSYSANQVIIPGWQPDRIVPETESQIEVTEWW